MENASDNNNDDVIEIILIAVIYWDSTIRLDIYFPRILFFIKYIDIQGGADDWG